MCPHCSKSNGGSTRRRYQSRFARPITLWPFPSKAIAERSRQVKGILTVELNAGQMVEDVRLAVECKVPVEYFGRLGGIVPDPDEVVTALKRKNY